MKTIIKGLESFLTRLDSYRDQLLFLFIKPFWPRRITPNMLTWVRIVISVGLFVLLFFTDTHEKSLILWLFIIGVLTDLLDGSIARGLNEVTEFGAMLDPVADRLLLVPIAIYGLLAHQKWLLLALAISELINAISAMHYKSKEIYKESNIFGKTKMVIQCLVFIDMLVVFPHAPGVFFIVLLWLSVIFTFFSVLYRTFHLHQKGHIQLRLLRK